MHHLAERRIEDGDPRGERRHGAGEGRREDRRSLLLQRNERPDHRREAHRRDARNEKRCGPHRLAMLNGPANDCSATQRIRTSDLRLRRPESDHDSAGNHAESVSFWPVASDDGDVSLRIDAHQSLQTTTIRLTRRPSSERERVELVADAVRAMLEVRAAFQERVP